MFSMKVVMGKGEKRTSNFADYVLPEIDSHQVHFIDEIRQSKKNHLKQALG